MNNHPSTCTPGAGSPALRAHKLLQDQTASSPRQIPFGRMPSLQEVSTAQHITITPASAPSTSSFLRSPYLSAAQCSPSISSMHQNYFSMGSLDTIELPGPSMPHTAGQSGPALPGTKPERLMRKLSNKAKGTLRRKTSSSSQSRRDESSGPVARRRSDSKTLTISSFVIDSDTGTLDHPAGLSANHQVGAMSDDLSASSDVASISDRRPDVVAPAVPDELVAGCTLTKSTRSKKQDKTFYLDATGSRVSWLGTMVTKSFHIDNIKSIRAGEDAISQWHAYRDGTLPTDCCFIVNYTSSEQSKDIKTLHLIAQNSRDQRLWVETLEALSKHREDLMTGIMGFMERQSILRAHWDAEVAKKSIREGQTVEDGLDLAAIAALCRKLHIHCSKTSITTAFEYADERNIGLLTFEHFRNFVRRLRERIDIAPIFKHLSKSHAHGITKETFLAFIQQTQGISFTSESIKSTWTAKADRLLMRSGCTCTVGGSCHIDFHTFASFLSSNDCRVYAMPEKIRPILDRPLNEYFISSSHNTYLLGRQVNGTSSVEAYVTALRRGCRSVEIDCWDGENDNPRVTHGFTKTTSVLFVDVIRAINRCAFDTSPYPVILSLEVHCNPVQQARMVEIMVEVFGHKLLLGLLSNHTSDLPSPEELTNKILVKVKAAEAHPNPAVVANDGVAAGRKRSTSSPYRRPIPINSASSLQQSLVPAHAQLVTSPPESFYSPTDRSLATTSASSDDDSDIHLTSPVPSEPGVRKVKTSKIIPALAGTAPYFQGFSYRGPHDLAFQQFNHIFSLNENTAQSLCTSADHKSIFEDHNLKHMCRVYPKSTRINSSNFDPNTFWRRGVQMVALNYQTYDTYMQMNQAMFAAGADQTGYVLKPSYLRKHRMAGGAFEHFDHRFKLPRYRISFSVNIISAQQLPRLASINKNDTIDPFIEVQMFSAEDRARGIASGSGGQGTSSLNDYHGIGNPFSRRTKVVRDNGYNPQFNDTIDLTLETKYPELVFVRFIVYQAGKNSRQLAVFTSKLDSLQRGYRHIPLFNSHGEELIFSTLFCQITKRDPILTGSSLQDLSQRTPRQRSFRTMLSRNLSVERGRGTGLTVEEKQIVRQKQLNREIEATAARK